MNNTQKFIVSTTLVLALMIPVQKSYAVIPVTDGMSISQIIATGITLTKQLTTLKQQYTLALNQFNEMRGITGIGRSISQQLTSTRNNLFSLKPPSDVFKTPLFTVDQLFPKPTKAKENYRRRGEFLQSNIEQVNKMYALLLDRKTTLNALKSEINNANTNKQILDLTARISAENGLLQNDIALINVMKISMELSTQALRYDEDGRAISGLKEAKDVN